MKRKMLRLALVGMALGAFAPNIGHAALKTACSHAGETSSSSSLTNSATAQDPATCTIEPILTRSSAQPVYIDDSGDGVSPEPGLDNANLRQLDFSAAAFVSPGQTGKLTVSVKTSDAVPGSFAGVTALRKPYGGVHVQVLFQSPTQDVEQVTGTGLSGNPSHFGPIRRDDGFHWMLTYGDTITENGVPSCQIGYYDPTGQTFFSITQSSVDTTHNYTCSNNVTTKTITFSVPETVTYTDHLTNLPFKLKLAGTNDAITNIKAFSWMDHEVGGPPPVGLVVGLTWYTDALPSSAYNFGIIAGDPNSGGVPGPKCQIFAGVQLPTSNPLNDGTRCYTDTPLGLGTGFNSTNLKVIGK